MYNDGDIFINRELSWLDFNRRVLNLACEENMPLGERLKFAAIYESNLNEFFMIRVGSLYDQTLLKKQNVENKTGMTAQQQIDAIMPKVIEQQAVVDTAAKNIFLQLKNIGMRKVDFENLDKDEAVYWKNYFMREIYPVLSPQIIDARHTFPFLRNLEVYVAAMLKEGKNEQPVLGIIPVGGHFERLIVVEEENGSNFALVEELILHFTHIVFDKSSIVEKCLFRVTRNADINIEEGMFDHDIDYREVMSQLIKKRRKLAAVRMQFFQCAPQSICSFLLDKLMLPVQQSYVQASPLNISFMHNISARLQRLRDESLFYKPVRAVLPEATYNLYQDIRRRDVLICYPHQSIRPFIQMLFEAARDEEVISIKMTLYRVANDSKVIEALIAAAENGKEVVTIVELRARFDEEKNIEWSRKLEQAGCTVVYGFSDYKVHSKLTLITRRKADGYEYISQIGTGNYNEKTSELYTDIAYFTSDTKTGEEVATVFNNLALERLTDHVDNLIVAPLRFKSVLLEEMQTEIRRQKEAGDGHILLKCNSISDKMVIETLRDASMAGVKADLIVRGICCLHAGISGATENITVRSLVGRYLEHARIYCFGRGERMRMYIASGDFLTRNTERRVEVGVRITDEGCKQVLLDILKMQIEDNVNACEMMPDGSYVRVPRAQGEKEVDSQMMLYDYLRTQTILQNNQDRYNLKKTKKAMPANRHGIALKEKKRRGLFARLFRRKKL